jgi:hypothetical protein
MTSATPDPSTKVLRGGRRVIWLLVYGLAVAAVTVAVTSWVRLDPWPVLGTRQQGFEASLHVVDEGGPPLVGRNSDQGVFEIPGEQYGPVAMTDDQGAYVYVPLLAHATGMRDPLDALALLYVAVFAVPIVLYPLVFYRLFHSLAPAVVAPIVLAIMSAAIAHGSFGNPDVYWLPAWAVLALLPPLLLIDRAWPRGSLPLIIALCVAASFATSIRSNAGLAVALSAAFVVLTHRPWSRLQRGGAVVLVVLAYLSISNFALSAVREHRDHWVDSSRFTEVASRNESHPFWDNAYIGLGYFPNDHGIFYRDDVSAGTVRRADPGAGTFGPEYERVLRDQYFDVVGDDPVFFLLNLAGKLVITVGQMTAWLVPLMLLGPFLLSVGDRAPMMRRCALLLTPAIALGLVPAIATVPFPPYELGLTGALGCACILLAAWLAAEVEDVVRKSDREPDHQPRLAETLARLRGLTATPAFRTRVPWAAGGLLLVAILLLVSKPLQHKADDWQIDHGGMSLSQRPSSAPGAPEPGRWVA